MVSEISVVALIVGLGLTVLNIINIFKAWKEKQNERIRSLVSNAQQESAAQTEQQVVTRADIDTIRQGNASIGLKVDGIDKKLDNFSERLTRCEESTKSANQRIDTLEDRPTYGRGWFGRR